MGEMRNNDYICIVNTRKTMKQETFTVSGMKCVNCKAKVENALKELAGVDSAVVSLKDDNVTVCYDELQVSPVVMKDAVDDLGRFEMTI